MFLDLPPCQGSAFMPRRWLGAECVPWEASSVHRSALGVGLGWEGARALNRTGLIAALQSGTSLGFVGRAGKMSSLCQVLAFALRKVVEGAPGGDCPWTTRVPCRLYLP